ncbi:MAG: DUF2817 domain-containing protein [Planctomycetota bacterium]
MIHALLVRCSLTRLTLALIFPVTMLADQAAEAAPPETSIVGKSLEGRPIECLVHGHGADVFMVIATIHGNEAAGTPLVAAFSKWLLAHPEELDGRQVVIVPVANPDGFAADKRFNMHGVDLNRNFPAGNWTEEEVNLHGTAPLSEPESRVLMQLVCRFFPARVVSIHQPVDCIDYDGPGQQLAEAMAAECPLEVKKLGGRPGSFGSFVGETLGKPIITLELPKDAGMDEKVLWQQYGQALIAALRFESPTPTEPAAVP